MGHLDNFRTQVDVEMYFKICLLYILLANEAFGIYIKENFKRANPHAPLVI